jgi:hypothetical protein
MNQLTLPFAVWLTVAYGELRSRARSVKGRLREDDGFDDVAKLIYLTVGVVLAIAAAGVAYKVFGKARDGIIDTNLPSPPAT